MMKTTRKLISATLAILMIFCMTMAQPVLAVEESSPVSTFAQQIPAQVEAIRTDNTLSDEQEIRELINLLFEAKRDQMANPTLGDFNFSGFWDENAIGSENLEYFERSVAAQKGDFAIYEEYAGDSTVAVSFNEIVVNGNTAEVEIYEKFEFIYKNADGSNVLGTDSPRSSIGLPYSITLNKCVDGWRIADIDFSNQATDVLRDTSIEVETFVEGKYEYAATLEESVILAENVFDPDAMPNSNYSYRTVDQTKFRSYAMLYDDNYNPAFHSFIGNDCQNFASQCLWYSLGGLTSSSSGLALVALPMITPSVSSSRSWYQNPSTQAKSYSWAGVVEFANYVAQGSTSVYGLYGFVASGVSSARIGDIIQIDFTYDGYNGYQHSYVVVYVMGVSTGKTPDDIYVSAHSEDVAYIKLSTQSGLFRTVRVNGLTTPNYDLVASSDGFEEITVY